MRHMYESHQRKVLDYFYLLAKSNIKNSTSYPTKEHLQINEKNDGKCKVFG